MADVLVKPAFQSAAADSGDATKLGPTAWNAARLFSGGVDGDIVTRDAASATGASWGPAPVTDLSGVVPITRTVNGHALSADVIVTKADVGLSLVENTALSTGNAATATLAAAAAILQTARTINGVSFNGSANITVTAAAGTLTGTALPAAVVTSSLTSVGPLTSLIVGGATAPGGVEGYFASTSASDPRGLMSAQYSTDAIGARFHLRKGRGTEAAPTTIVTADVLGRIRFSGYDGANYLQSGSIDVVSTGTIAATRVPTYMTFSVATDAAPSVLTEVLRLTATGVTFGAPIVGVLTTSVNAIATTSTDGSVLQNTTAATVGVPVQISPRQRFRGAAYNTISTLSETHDWLWEVLPSSAAGTTTSVARLGTSFNGGALTYPFTVSGAGLGTFLSGVTLGVGASVTFSACGFLTGGGGSGLYLLRNLTAAAGVGFDVSADAIFKVRTRTLGSTYATVDALGYSVSGVAGASKAAGPVTSITVVNGIVTAIS